MGFLFWFHCALPVWEHYGLPFLVVALRASILGALWASFLVPVRASVLGALWAFIFGTTGRFHIEQSIYTYFLNE